MVGDANEQAIRDFFQGWQLYQQVIAGNYMLHEQIAEQLRTVLQPRMHPGMAVLELGCGDAYVLSRVLAGSRIAHYRGIDLSAPALDFARQNLAGLAADVQLHADTMQKAADYVDRRYDLIIAGYSLHHLVEQDKRALLGWLRRQLTEGGELFVYDVFRRDGESREHYLQRCVDAFRAQWSSLNPAQHARVAEHVLQQDYPESLASWERLARDAGFGRCEWLLRDAGELFGISRLSLRPG